MVFACTQTCKPDEIEMVYFPENIDLLRHVPFHLLDGHWGAVDDTAVDRAADSARRAEIMGCCLQVLEFIQRQRMAHLRHASHQIFG
eukprot:Gb_09696 [translate_table: standard]